MLASDNFCLRSKLECWLVGGVYMCPCATGTRLPVQRAKHAYWAREWFLKGQEPHERLREVFKPQCLWSACALDQEATQKWTSRDSEVCRSTGKMRAWINWKQRDATVAHIIGHFKKGQAEFPFQAACYPRVGLSGRSCSLSGNQEGGPVSAGEAGPRKTCGGGCAPDWILILNSIGSPRSGRVGKPRAVFSKTPDES